MAEISVKETIFRDSLSQEDIYLFHEIIYKHYREKGRKLPWRETHEPYFILVSEIMLQQTPVERVIEKYKQFIATFPDFSSLAKAPLYRILEVWQGLGYNRRAIALKRIAEIVEKRYHGILPSTAEILITFPGIGRYTASAISAFAFNKPTVFIETNIRSVFIHFFFHNRNKIKDNAIFPLVEKTLDKSNPREWYYALMDYGRMLKKKYRNPSRRSIHYHIQPPFIDSNRQIRGLILRLLIETSGKKGVSQHIIIEHLKMDPQKVSKNLIQLQREGFIKKERNKFMII